MKKASPLAVFTTALLCFIFWLLITGQIVESFQSRASMEIVIAGILVSLLAALFSARFFIHKDAVHFLRPARLLSLLGYIPVFCAELFKANVDMARRALSPKLPIHPGIVKVPVDLKTEYGQAMLANSITLTPGTITMDIAEEEETGKVWYYIHWIDVTDTDHEKAGESIKGTLEKWVRRIWE